MLCISTEEERLEAERAALSDKERKHWAGISTKTLGFSVETMSDIGGLALRTESQMKLAAAPKSGDGGMYVGGIHVTANL